MKNYVGFYQVPCYELARTTQKGGAVCRFCIKTFYGKYFFAETTAGLNEVYLVKNGKADDWFKMTYFLNKKGVKIIKSIEKAIKTEVINFYK